MSHTLEVSPEPMNMTRQEQIVIRRETMGDEQELPNDASVIDHRRFIDSELDEGNNLVIVPRNAAETILPEQLPLTRLERLRQKLGRFVGKRG